jgi:transglutaminase-like putative cysteine protease
MTGRRLAALAILGIWVAVAGMHVRREYFRPAVERLALGARDLAPGSYFFTVRMNDAVIGVATSSLDTVDGGFDLRDDLVLDVPALGDVTRARASTRVILDDSLSLREFVFRLGSSVGTFAVTGTVTGRETLELAIAAGGDEEKSRIRITQGISMDAVVPLRLAAAGALVPGRVSRVRVFDPSTMAERDVEVRVTAADTLIVPDSAGLGAGGRWFAAGYDTIPVWRVEQSLGTIAIATWVDEDGLTVKAESPMGYTIERTAFEVARQALDDARRAETVADGYGVLIEGTAVASNVDLSRVAERDSLAVRIGGVDLAGFDLAGGRQELRGDTLVIRRERTTGPAAYALPYSRGAPEVAAELASTPLIQADDRGIERAAREATDGTRDPHEAARRLTAWVYGALVKEIVPSVPSALQVLESRRGDCNEHTVLYVAMARSIGLPARTAVGLVHVRGSFYYHAWPEVWLGDAWVAMDPTLGQTPADASHLRFLVGGLARQVELIRLVGRLELEVL